MNGERKTRQIRILNGPLRGVTHVIDERVSIGRASSSDLQLVHDGISRQHAQIVIDEAGRHVLVDLDSSNGTFVQSERIRRHVLDPGATFKIMRVKLIYEPVTDDEVDCDDSGVFAVHTVDHRTLRGTVDYGDADLPAPTSARPTEGADSEDDAPQPRTASGSSGTAAVRPRDGERHRVVATRADGSTYEGSLIDDVVGYRELRTRIHRGDDVRDADQERFESLEQRLRCAETQETPGRRTFHRFGCNFPAKLRFADGSELTSAVLDMGVDGAKLRVYDHQIEHDAIVWLAIHLVSRGRALTVVFTSRVIWTTSGHVGLGFAGAPDWENRGHRKLEVRTHMDLGEQVRAARRALGRIKLRRKST